MRAEVEALVASIRYDPPVAVLDPSDGPRIAAIGLAKAKANDPSFDCFPSVPGPRQRRRSCNSPCTPACTKPLPVTCTTAIEPVAIGLWKMTLTESWTAASDRSAGSLTTTIWLAPDGTPGETDGGPAPSEMPTGRRPPPPGRGGSRRHYGGLCGLADQVDLQGGHGVQQSIRKGGAAQADAASGPARSPQLQNHSPGAAGAHAGLTFVEFVLAARGIITRSAGTAAWIPPAPPPKSASARRCRWPPR